MAVVPITIPAGALGTAVTGNLELQVSANAPAVVIGATATETVINSGTVAGAPPAFGVELANDPGLLPTHTGSVWTFDLGSLKQGELFSPGTLSLAILNQATSGADDLAGSIVSAGSTGLATSALSSFASLQPGGIYDVANVLVSTSTLGVQTETLTVTPYNTNISGYAAVLPAQTVVVTDTIYPLAAATIISAGSIDFGAVRGGSVVEQAVTIENSGPAGGESLDANAGAVTNKGAGSGFFTHLAPGATSTAVEAGRTRHPTAAWLPAPWRSTSSPTAREPTGRAPRRCCRERSTCRARYIAWPRPGSR